MSACDSASAEPAFSVVVAAFSGESSLQRCLDGLQVQSIAPEIIVATNAGISAIDRWVTLFPQVRFIDAGRDADVFRLRALGVAEARGGLVALTEDHCVASPGWLAALSHSLRSGHSIVGGAIKCGLDRGGYAFALYLCEYGLYLPPVPSGPAATLSGVNVAYSRDALRSCRAVWQNEFRENEVHDALIAAGHGLYLVEDALVKSYLAFSFPAALAHLFSGGVRYGAYRMRHASALSRVLRAFAAPVVPIVLLGRIARCVAARQPRRIGRLIQCLPYLVCLLTAWAAGEAVGCLRSRSPVAGIAAPHAGGA